MCYINGLVGLFLRFVVLNRERERVIFIVYVYLLGVKVKQANVLIQFPCDSQLDKISNEDLQKAIVYLLSIHK